MSNTNSKKIQHYGTRLSKRPLQILEGVEVVVEGNKLLVSGAKTKAEMPINTGISVAIDKDSNKINITADPRAELPVVGTFYAKLKSLMQQVKSLYSDSVQLKGVGYKVFIAKAGDKQVLVLNVGCSHLHAIVIPSFLEVEVADVTKVNISGLKEQVSFFVDELKKIRPWDPCRRSGVVRSSEIPYLVSKSGKKS